MRDLQPRLLLPYLAECLTLSDESAILATLKSESETHANLKLLHLLVKRDRFWETFLKALKHPDINQGHIARNLEKGE